MPKTRKFSNHIENNLGEEHQFLLDIHVYSELPKYSTTEGKNVTDSTENHWITKLDREVKYQIISNHETIIAL